MNNVLAHAAATPPDHSTREIPLTQGKVALVDAADYDFLMQWKWYAHNRRDQWYATRHIEKARAQSRHVYMHRVILKVDSNIKVDHIDGDGLNNRRSNLRPATSADNAHNCKRYKNNTSGYKGVDFHKSSGRWQARISVNGKPIHLGGFDDPREAALAYDAAAREAFGEFARTNFPPNKP